MDVMFPCRGRGVASDVKLSGKCFGGLDDTVTGFPDWNQDQLIV